MFPHRLFNPVIRYPECLPAGIASTAAGSAEALCLELPEEMAASHPGLLGWAALMPVIFNWVQRKRA